MSYWSLETAEQTPGIHLPDQQLSDALSKNGLSLDAARQALLEHHIVSLELDLLAVDGDTVAPVSLLPPDYLLWSWIPIFSSPARALVLELGGAESDFWPCHFRNQPDTPRFMHLPANIEHVVDVVRSSFLMTIPGDPPLPFHITDLVLQCRPAAHCFRAAIPSHQQVFSEFFIDDLFRHRWIARHLSGAVFRCITHHRAHEANAVAAP